jgi:hypothetical protein
MTDHQISLPLASARLQQMMSLAGWEIDYIDLDLTGEKPKADIRIKRDDGRWLLARVDGLGRATVERFQRTRYLGMSPNTKGRQPLSPQIDDSFLGRDTYIGARAMLRNLTAYLADNALRPVALSDMRANWAAVMGSPLRLESTGTAKGSA